MEGETKRLEFLPLGFRQCKVGIIPFDKLAALLKNAVKDIANGEAAMTGLSHVTNVIHALVCEHSPGVTEQEVQIWTSVALSSLALNEFERQMRALMPSEAIGTA